MYKDLSLVYECYSCGLFVKEDEESNLTQRCPRCDSKIKTEKKHSIDSLYYALSAIFLFIILSTYPFLTLDLNEQKLQATLIKTVVILFEQDFFFLSLLVLFTIVIAPILNSLIIILFFIQEKFNLQIFKKSFLYDSFHFIKHWGFIEVFVISLVVTYIKLIGMVSNTKFDIGFFIILFYVLCFFMSNLKFEAKTILKD